MAATKHDAGAASTFVASAVT